jgi:hypothetical protein
MDSSKSLPRKKSRNSGSCVLLLNFCILHCSFKLRSTLIAQWGDFAAKRMYVKGRGSMISVTPRLITSLTWLIIRRERGLYYAIYDVETGNDHGVVRNEAE